MNKLILIKHAMPHIIPGQPPQTWALSDEGRQKSALLAERLTPYQPHIMTASCEAKASETGRIVAERLCIPFTEVKNLHEHDRTGEPFTTQAAFEASVHNFFANPDRLVYGRETADEAHQRFATAVHGVIENYAGQTIAIAAHGTVIALYMSRRCGMDAFDLWQRLGLPSLVVLSLTENRVLDVIEEIN